MFEAIPTHSTAQLQWTGNLFWGSNWAKLLATAHRTSHLANKTCSTKVASASASMCFFYMPYHFTTPHKPAQTTRKPKWTILLEQNFGVHIKTWSTVCVTMTRACSQRLVQGDPWISALPKRRRMERKSGKCTGSSKPIVVHTTKEWISEAVVGIVVFASVFSRSLDKDPSWTPCGRSSYGTCWIWPMHLSKLHAPSDTWNCWGNGHGAVWSQWPNPQRTLTNCSGISREIVWWKVKNSNSIQILSCVMCIKQFSSLTKAVHSTAWNTSAAGLQVLHGRLEWQRVK